MSADTTASPPRAGRIIALRDFGWIAFRGLAHYFRRDGSSPCDLALEMSEACRFSVDDRAKLAEQARGVPACTACKAVQQITPEPNERSE